MCEILFDGILLKQVVSVENVEPTSTRIGSMSNNLVLTAVCLPSEKVHGDTERSFFGLKPILFTICFKLFFTVSDKTALSINLKDTIQHRCINFPIIEKKEKEKWRSGQKNRLSFFN